MASRQTCNIYAQFERIRAEYGQLLPACKIQLSSDIPYPGFQCGPEAHHAQGHKCEQAHRENCVDCDFVHFGRSPFNPNARNA